MKTLIGLTALCMAFGVRTLRAAPDSCTFDVNIATVCVTYNGETSCENQTYITESCTYPLTWCDSCLNAEDLCHNDCQTDFNTGVISQMELFACNNGCRRARNNCFHNCGT